MHLRTKVPSLMRLGRQRPAQLRSLTAVEQSLMRRTICAHLIQRPRWLYGALCEDLTMIGSLSIALRGLVFYQFNALCAADELIIPVNSQAMALSGVAQLEATLDKLRDAEVIQHGPVRRLVLTMYDPRRALAREVREYVAGREASHVYETTIRASARIAECYGHHRTIYEYAPREGVAEFC